MAYILSLVKENVFNVLIFLRWCDRKLSVLKHNVLKILLKLKSDLLSHILNFSVCLCVFIAVSLSVSHVCFLADWS